MVLMFDCASCNHMKDKVYPHRYSDDLHGVCEVTKKTVLGTGSCEEFDVQQFNGVAENANTEE